MANFDIHLGKTRTFQLTPTKDGLPFPVGATNPIFGSSAPEVFQLSTGPGGEFTINGKLITPGNAFLTWQFQVPSGATISGSETITGLDNPPADEANGGLVEAGPEF